MNQSISQSITVPSTLVAGLLQSLTLYMNNENKQYTMEDVS